MSIEAEHGHIAHRQSLREKIPLPHREIDSQGIIRAFNSRLRDGSLNVMLEKRRLTNPERSPQILSSDAILLFADSFLRQAIKRINETRPMAFAIAWDYSFGMITVADQLIPVLKTTGIKPEDIEALVKETLLASVMDNPTVREAINEKKTVYTLIQEDPSGISLTEYLVGLVKRELQKSPDQPLGNLQHANQDFVILGAEIAGIIYTTSYTILTNNQESSPLTK